MKTQAASPNKQEQAYEWIKSRIMDGTFGAGYRLVIDRLARELGISAIPIREAVRRLEAEGLVEVERFSGVRVTRIDEQVYVETLSVLALLEGYATALAAPHMTEDDWEALRTINTKMEQARVSFALEEYSNLNKQFHERIWRACPNTYLVNQLKSVQERMDTVRATVFMLIPHRTTDSIAEHEELIRLMADGAGADQIESFARAHKLATLEAFRRWRKTRRE
ncbi:GntR family transcriptional regulator [Alicyclobacillus shizuokensis]|uniref:GntR family transcriptional regulator n=1 Tax=Alicyclobacillus shizuokensis TaxID=392014 RepID=UPI00082A7A0B|nr:GntR family transcriptional regulator [Alicyclobacillus shizuokensis]MCL6625865.1 GntR family transcriptional regulator [Alicyclobacillus shizuokensis]